MNEFLTLQGDLPTRLANRMSETIAKSLHEGMEPDEACCIAVAVIADYARGVYGNKYLPDLAKVLLAQAKKPMPEFVEVSQ